MCGFEGWGALHVWVSAVSTAMFVVGDAIGACGSWELLYTCVVSGGVDTQPGRCKELLGEVASFSFLRDWGVFGDIFGALAASLCRLRS